jgi:uncharacterized protein (DUF433 family)
VSKQTLDRVYTAPLYTKGEVARIVSASPSTVHSWLLGRAEDGRSYPPVIDGAAKGTGPQVSFTGLAEVYVLNAFRKAGLPLQRIRPAVQMLKDNLQLDHALANKRLVTDGAEVLIKSDDRADQRLMVVRNGQAVFNEVVEGYLKQIDFGDLGYASSIALPQFTKTRVVVRPLLNGGRPSVESRGIAIDDVLSRVRAGEPPADVAEDYRLNLDDLLYLNYAAA